ncbi:MAG: diaminobutyrate acetyltransferase [Acidimicrobiia bacterium]|nr:diaminobutyrate acetyltransferase [Acidimicrobiia bacterium]
MTFGPPAPGDGPELWRLAGATGLDVNAPYTYLLVVREFAATSVVVRDGRRVVAFIVGFRRPEAPDTLFVWQVAVAGSHRQRGVALRMLDHLVDRLLARGVRWVEATVTPSNRASLRFFRSFARGRGAECREDELFGVEAFPPEAPHEEELLLRIGPLEPAREGD